MHASTYAPREMLRTLVRHHFVRNRLASFEGSSVALRFGRGAWVDGGAGVRPLLELLQQLVCTFRDDSFHSFRRNDVATLPKLSLCLAT